MRCFLVSGPSGIPAHLLLLTGQVSVFRTSTQFFKYTLSRHRCRYLANSLPWAHRVLPCVLGKGSAVWLTSYGLSFVFSGWKWPHCAPGLCFSSSVTTDPQMQAPWGQKVSSNYLVSLANKILLAVGKQLAAPASETIYRARKIGSHHAELCSSVVVVGMRWFERPPHG